MESDLAIYQRLESLTEHMRNPKLKLKLDIILFFEANEEFWRLKSSNQDF